MPRAFTRFAFTNAVRQMQKEQGASNLNASLELDHIDANDSFGPDEVEFISGRDNFYQSTVTETGWPYVQHRGGPAGFLKVMDDKTIAYADYSGNRQYMSDGNLKADDRIALILMDYINRRRLKIWGNAELIEAREAGDILPKLHDSNYKALPERVVKITLVAFDWNCPRHIKPRFTEQEIQPAIQTLQNEIEQLKNEIERLKASGS